MAAIRVSGACRALAAIRPSSVLLACILAAAAGRLVVPLGDPDFWFHVRTGQWIFEHGQVPTHDLYTYTVPTNPWIDYEYLTEVLTWLVYTHAGLLGVSLVFGALTWLGFLFLYLTVIAERPPYLIAAGGLALALAATGAVWGPRPQMITFTLASVELYWLRRFLSGSSRAVYALPALVAVWANLHAGWPIALVLLAVAVLTEAFHWASGQDRSAHAHNLRRLAVVLLGTIAAPLATPHGLSVYAAPLGPLASPAQQVLINEWHSPDFHAWYSWPLLVMILLLVASMTASRPRLFDFLVSLLTLAMALMAVRHVAIFILGATPTLITAWSRVFHTAQARWPAMLERRRPGRLPGAVATLLVACLATGWLTAWRLGQQDELIRTWYPVDAATWLARHPGVGTRMYNDYSWGGYLAYRLYPAPNRRLFVFGEGTVMGDDLLWRYARVENLEPGWRQVLDQAGVDYVVCRRQSPLAAVLTTEPDWKFAYGDATSAIFVRQGAAAAVANGTGGTRP